MTFCSFLHSAQIHNLVLNSYSWNKNARNVKNKIKSNIPQPVQGVRHATLLRELYYKDKNVNQAFLLIWTTVCFLNYFQIHQEAFYRDNLEGGEIGHITGENTPCTTISNTKFSTKKRNWIFRGVWLCLPLLLYYAAMQLLAIVFTSVNESTN